jgi:hypothetical protein
MVREIGFLFIAFFANYLFADSQWGLVVQDTHHSGTNSSVKIQYYSMSGPGLLDPSPVTVPYNPKNFPPLWTGFFGEPDISDTWVLFGGNQATREIWFLNAFKKTASSIKIPGRSPLASVTGYSGDEALAMTEEGTGYVLTSDPLAPMKTINLRALMNLNGSKRVIDAVRVNEDRLIVLTDTMIAELEISKINSGAEINYNFTKTQDMPDFKWKPNAKLTVRGPFVWISGKALKKNETKAVDALAFIHLSAATRKVEFQTTDFLINPLSVVAPAGDLLYLRGDEYLELSATPSHLWKEVYGCSGVDRTHHKLVDFPISLSKSPPLWNVFLRASASNFWNQETRYAELWNQTQRKTSAVTSDPDSFESTLLLLVDVIKSHPRKIHLSRRLTSNEFAAAFSQSPRTDYLGKRFQNEELKDFGLKLATGYSPLIEWDTSQGESTVDLVLFAEKLWQVIQKKKSDACGNAFL